MRSLLEWVLAVGLLAAVVWAGAPVVQRLIPAPPGTVTLVQSALPDLPEGVPAGAESAPLVILPDGTEFRVGMTEPELAATPAARWASGEPLVRKGIFGDRVIRPYQAGRTAFWVVLDRIEPRGERQVTAIYVR